MAKVNALLVRHRDGLSEFTDAPSIGAHGRQEGYLEMGQATATEAGRAADAAFAFAAADQWAVRIGVTTPGVALVGDTVTAPGPDGAPVSTRLMALTTTEDATGRIIYSPEVGDVLLDPEGRVRQWLTRQAHGTLGGRSASAQPIGGGGSTGIGNPIPGAPASDSTTLPHSTQTSDYTLVLTDAGTVVEMNVASANLLTIPPHSSVAFPVDTILEVFQLDTGQTTVAPSSGVTLLSDGGRLNIAGRYGSIGLRQRDIDVWVLTGDLAF